MIYSTDITYNEFITTIINTRGQWNIPDGIYYEAHHIIPKCLGGTGKPRSKDANIIWLLPIEHLIAHYLLWVENKTNTSLAYAFSCMISGLNSCIETIVENQDLYNKLKQEAFEANVFKNKELAKSIPKAERMRRAYIGGNANKQRLTNEAAHNDFVNKCISRHANMAAAENKQYIQNQVLR